MSPLRTLLVFLLWLLCAQAQWINHPTIGIPRTKDGKVNVSAPAPRDRDGKPDLSGIWTVTDQKYLDNLGADGVEIPMLPWAAKIYAERQENNGRDRPSGRCLPHGVTDFDALFQPRKFIQTPTEIVLLFESYHSYRQIFMDGRALPKSAEPSWFGASVGKWMGDTLVVETAGLSDETWLDDGGHPHTDALRLTERFHRRDFGHLDVEITINDPKTYAKPWTVKIPWDYLPDTELLDWVCENNRDVGHMVGK
jgi:hypothetical protein